MTDDPSDLLPTITFTKMHTKDYFLFYKLVAWCIVVHVVPNLIIWTMNILVQRQLAKETFTIVGSDYEKENEV